MDWMSMLQGYLISIVDWMSMLQGYLISISIETPILLIGLSARHSIGVRLFCGVWLTACTYPMLWLVLPQMIDRFTNRVLFLSVGETFVPIAECGLFWAAFGTRAEWGRWSMWRDLITITTANLASFGFGEWIYAMGWLGSGLALPS